MVSLKAAHYKGRGIKYHYKMTKKLTGNPQLKGVCVKIRLVKPKKPNSAVRKIAKVRLSNNYTVLAYVPGQGHNLREHSRVLLRGGRTPDLPGLHYKLIRGKYDFSWQERFTRVNRRSKFGVPK